MLKLNQMICRIINLPLHQSSGEAKSNLFVNSNRRIIYFLFFR